MERLKEQLPCDDASYISVDSWPFVQSLATKAQALLVIYTN